MKKDSELFINSYMFRRKINLAIVKYILLVCDCDTHVVYCIKVKKPRVQLPYYNYKVYLVFSKKVKNLYTANKITWTLKTMLPSTYFLKYLCLGDTDQYIQCVHASDISSSRPSYSLPKQYATVKNCCIMVNKVWNVSD